MDEKGVTLDRMRTFVRVAERGSLSAVARETGAGQSTITRHLRELEEALGVPLLSRTTRRVTLTDEGSRYYDHAIQILRQVERAGEEARNMQESPGGRVRVSCTAAIGVLHFSRLIFEFQDKYPDVRVDFSLNDERIDLVREGVDVAIRLGPLADSSMKLRALGHSERLLVAAPSYLTKRGKPAGPKDIADHEGIRMSNVPGSDRLVLLDSQGEHFTVPFDGHLRVDHGLAVRTALLAGRGIAPAHRWLIDDLLGAGQLEAMLPAFRLPAVPLNMLIVPERAGISRVRLLIDFLADRVKDIPGIEPG